MLNELSALAHSLEASRLAVESWDGRIKPYKKGPAFVVRLASDGSVARVEWLDEERVESLRRISPQNEKSFPGFNLNHPVYRIELAADAKGSIGELKDRAWAYFGSSEGELALGGEVKDRRALDGNLRYPGAELRELDVEEEDLAPTRALLQRMRGLDAESFLQGLGKAVIGSVERGELDREAALLLLCGKYNKKKCRFEPAKPTVILDIEDTYEVGGQVASPESVRGWNRALLRSAEQLEGAQIVCALSGREDASIGKKLPKLHLPGVGPRYLMSMNKATPCHTRYGLTSAAVFPIGASTGRRLSDALRFVTEETRSGKTFAKIPKANSDESDLLVAYLEADPGSDLPIVDLFADVAEQEAGQLAIYEARTHRLLEALQGKRGYKSDTAVRIFAISKLDPEKAQVLFTGRYCVTELEAGLREWIDGMRNIPGFGVWISGRPGKREEMSAQVPSPISVLRCFKTQWMRGGTESTQTPGVDLAQLYRLMLDRENSLAGPLLNRHLHLTGPLLGGIGRLRSNVKAVPEGGRRAALDAVSVIGLLLWKTGFTKEIYMESSEFLLGQYLQFADRLHKLYCEVVRKGDVPPQLAGNAALGAALQSPQRAFVTTSQRVRTYWAWADGVQGDKAGLAIWLRRRMGDVCGRLGSQGLPERTDDSGRAQIFLGYLGEVTTKEERA